jgi:hypothetical protein
MFHNRRGTSSRACLFPKGQTVRKVRTPQGRTPGNTRAPRGDGKCNRKDTAPQGVRVKWRGKSSPRKRQRLRQGKPRPVQDQIYSRLRAARFRLWVDRKETHGNMRPRWMAAQTEFGLWSPPVIKICMSMD